MIAHYEDTRSNTFFIQLINLKQKGSITEHIENFQRLNIKVTNIPNEHLIDVFIGTLKDNIQHDSTRSPMHPTRSQLLGWSIHHLTITTAFGSNFDGAFDAIATFYYRKTDKPGTPSNVVSHDVVFPTT